MNVKLNQELTRDYYTIMGGGGSISILTLFNPNNFLYTPPPIIQNRYWVTY